MKCACLPWIALLIRLLPALCVLLSGPTGLSSEERRPPNVLFIAIDDLNDWVGFMGGHRHARTPHMDALAASGTTFLNAHCNAPLCNPSRTSLMLGRRPSSTGIYGLVPRFRQVPEWTDAVTLPQHFKSHGYRTLSAGKIYHDGMGDAEQRAREFDVWGPAGGIGVRPPEKLIPPTPMGNHPLMDWGTFPHRDEDKGDYQVASWGIEQLETLAPDQPFFLALGFFLPHVPCYTTQSWLEAIPDDEFLLPPVFFGDRKDTPRFSWNLHWHLPEPRLNWLQSQDQWCSLVRSYLACVSFIDHQVGRVLHALQNSVHAKNTVVVLWSDHGFHLGEKLITGKNTLWERSTRVPLVFAGPGIAVGARTPQPAELLDLYPTLIDLCGLPSRPELEGISLRPQLANAAALRHRPAITTHNVGNHSVRSHRWRYIQYADGSEELYDHTLDPHEWTNLAKDPALDSILARHRRWLPQINKPPVPGSAHRILTYDPATDVAVWEGQTIRREDPVPE